ncbi:hypothetical protein [Nannocystis radixulma]|uniref:Uncharacterized protein n=1 Tax=Nannocystis radixulma TaxID=2995305 RepID=A0ABT5BH08_9BACT|nr:hypothetical protein [Nannocystis radixulma]MDC0673442.1 hypothetical protein [Nannocystis radixulma]
MSSRKFNGAMFMEEGDLFFPPYGLDRADWQCQRLAEAELLDGTFTAWLSVGMAHAGQRAQGDGGVAGLPLVRSDGVVIADDWIDFIDKHLNAEVTLTEGGELPDHDDFKFWSATWADGMSAAEVPGACGGWLFACKECESRVGNAELTGESWSDFGSSHCDKYRPLLCIQTSLQNPPAP